MKKMKKIISLFSLLLILVSCGKSDNVIDTVLSDYVTGAVIRGWNPRGDYNYFAPETSVFKVTLEEHDAEKGKLMESVDVYVDLNGTTEELFLTLLPADFTKDANSGLPRYDLEVSLSDALTKMGLSTTQISGGDFVNIRIALNLTDGRTYTAKDAASSLTGSYFKSPYTYAKQIKCIPSEAIPGTYTINMIDSYGDGWNGGYIIATVDGVERWIGIPDYWGDYPELDPVLLWADGPENFVAQAGNYSLSKFSFSIPADAVSMSWVFVTGDYMSEVSYSITVDVGNGVEQSAFSESNPAAGTKVLSVCPA